ncbi:hypothetical protein [Rugosimonospora africana]|nr:hypothetical protein [Rugosimonospora africana]
MIVAAFARPDSTIVALGHDPALAGAAGAFGCDYRTVATAKELADLGYIAGRVALVVLPWPSGEPDGVFELAALQDMFAACRTLLARDGVTCVVLTADRFSDGYDQHGPQLVSAADDSDLNLIRHILAVTEPVAGSHRPPHATTAVSSADHVRSHIRKHVLLFVIGGRRG